uniref:Uncharacterized protein n=1 Tax=Parascaris equorum TaxID=6256 RepID=A0A914S706_PAREQ
KTGFKVGFFTELPRTFCITERKINETATRGEPRSVWVEKGIEATLTFIGMKFALMIPLNKNGEADNHLLAHPDARHEAAKINDELRFSIIDAVYLRPAIWDHGREPKSLGQRKDYFIEIAALLSTEDNILSCNYISVFFLFTDVAFRVTLREV